MSIDIDSDKARKHFPGEPGIWIFIFNDLCIFLLFFATFLYYRVENLELFRSSQYHLNQAFGILNTSILLTSSLAVVKSIENVRRGSMPRARLFMKAGITLGIAFMVVKIIEYSEKISAGLTPVTNMFYTFYFMLTGIHLLHVIIGTALLTFLLFRLKDNDSRKANMITLESGAIFWHMVDIIWVIIFPIFYLVK